ncbi:ABC transporter permease [Actibacterium sp. 188UL27-1]|uniref:ABC transporter permease n=1 Tax=Actibacterium sp. 188UL27-1 TaxID=2786961 RepID=UPI001955F616|nr:ABC transporter permease [Actibacterium sp. 188UL27-1]MBM7068554.1 ABC transporter permease [Actibacterium sp. 188UL27-1]
MIRGVISAITILLIWQAIVVLSGWPPFILPGPLRVLEALWANLPSISYHASITLSEVLIGLVLGALLGALTAIQLAASPVARYIVQPILVVTQGLPVFALAPILTLWLGFGIWSKVLMAVLIIYFPVTIAFFDGLMRTPPGWLDLARTMGGSPTRTLIRIRIPAAIPQLAAGLKLSAVYAPIGAIIGEWVGASKGLGYLMLLANGRVKTDLMFAALIVLALMTLALHYGVGALCNRLQKRFS